MTQKQQILNHLRKGPITTWKAMQLYGVPPWLDSDRPVLAGGGGGGMMRYHIVRITIERYIRLYSFVLRDGHTGRRYSVSQCKDRLGMGSFDTLDNLAGVV